MSSTQNKRTKIQIAEDRREIAAQYLRGKTQAEIAAYISTDPARGYTLTVQQISYDLRKIQAQWRESSLRDFDELRAQELAKVDELERTYWQAWLDSCAALETITQEGTGDGVAKVKKTSKPQNGDPRFLSGVERCIERRCRLLGLDAPAKSELTGKDGAPLLYPLADVIRELRQAEEA